jgi:ribosomal protein L13
VWWVQITNFSKPAQNTNKAFTKMLPQKEAEKKSVKNLGIFKEKQNGRTTINHNIQLTRWLQDNQTPWRNKRYYC